MFNLAQSRETLLSAGLELPIWFCSLRRRGAKFVWLCHGFDGLGGFLKVFLSDSQSVYYNYVLRKCLLTFRSFTIHNAAGVLCLIWIKVGRFCAAGDSRFFD